MMDKIFRILIVLFLMTLNAHAAVVATHVSGGTVGFSGTSPAATSLYGSTGQTITFNSITNYLYFMNESVDYDCYVNIECRPTDSYAGSLEYYTVKVPAAGGTTPNTIELDFATQRLSFWTTGGRSKGVSGNVVFIVTGVQGDL